MQISFLKNIPLIVLLSVTILSCKENKKVPRSTLSKEITSANKAEKDSVPVPQPNPAQLRIKKINAEVFQSAIPHGKASRPLEKITDFQTVQTRLAGIVDFEEQGDYINVKKINFSAGVSPKSEIDLSECTFRAYFPTEDVLLLECGHTTDVSLQLSTGETTYQVGNLSLVNTSPTGKYRLNKVFEGQKCFYHFIQEKKHGKFQKVFELDKIFKKRFNKWLCIIEKGFWTDDETFYFREAIQYKAAGNVY